MNFILFQLKFLKFKSKIKFIKFELHNYDACRCHGLRLSVLNKETTYLLT